MTCNHYMLCFVGYAVLRLYPVSHLQPDTSGVGAMKCGRRVVLRIILNLRHFTPAWIKPISFQSTFTAVGCASLQEFVGGILRKGKSCCRLLWYYNSFFAYLKSKRGKTIRRNESNRPLTKVECWNELNTAKGGLGNRSLGADGAGNYRLIKYLKRLRRCIKLYSFCILGLFVG